MIPSFFELEFPHYHVWISLKMFSVLLSLPILKCFFKQCQCSFCIDYVSLCTWNWELCFLCWERVDRVGAKLCLTSVSFYFLSWGNLFNELCQRRSCLWYVRLYTRLGSICSLCFGSKFRGVTYMSHTLSTYISLAGG